MRRGRTALLTCALATSIVTGSMGADTRKAAPAGSQAPAFATGVELVVVDAAVLDERGRAVAGLQRGDFRVLEDGKPQRLSSFEAFDVAEPSEVPQPEAITRRVVTNRLPPQRAGRTFVIVFDDLHLTPGMGAIAKQAIGDFATTGLRDGDRVSLVSTGSGHWWNTTFAAGREDFLAVLDKLSGNKPPTTIVRMSEFEARQIVHEDRGGTEDPSGLTPPGFAADLRPDSRGVQAPGDRPLEVRERVRRRWENEGFCSRLFSSECYHKLEQIARETYDMVSTRSKLTLEALERVLEALAAQPGRKSVVLVSGGFIYDPGLEQFREVVSSARRANAAIYFVDVRGLRALSPAMGAEVGKPIDNQDWGGVAFEDAVLSAAGSETVAEESGGFSVRNSNDFVKGMERISDESRVYYLLGYYPSNTKRDGHFRKIEVKVNRPGLEVRARRGYFAPKEGEEAAQVEAGERDIAMRTALDGPSVRSEIPLRLASYVFDETSPGKARVLVAIEVDVSRLSFTGTEAASSAAVDLQVAILHRDASETLAYKERLEVPQPAPGSGEVWMPVVREFEVPPGVCQAKIVARDAGSGAMGSVVQRFEVPELAGLRVSTPILSDLIEPQAVDGGGRRRPVLLARRTFRAAEDGFLYCQFEVYGAARESGEGGQATLTTSHVLVDREGRPVQWAKPAPLVPSTDGRVVRMLGLPTAGMAPGEYDLILVIDDQQGSKSLEIHEPFTISGG